MKSMAGMVAGHHHWMHQVMQSAAGASGLWTTASRVAKRPSQCLQCPAWLAGQPLLTFPACCLSCLLLPAFPACCLLPFLPIAACSTTTVCCLSSAARLQLWTLSSVLALVSFATCSKAEEHSHGLACGRLLCFVLAGMLQTSLLQC